MKLGHGLLIALVLVTVIPAACGGGSISSFALGFDAKAIWAANFADDTVTKLGLDGRDLGTFSVGHGHTALDNDGDANDDGIVDLKDVSILGSAFGAGSSQESYVSSVDFNEDGVIDVRDAAILAANFGSMTVSPVNAAPVAGSDGATTNEDAPVTIAVLANDIDGDGDTLSVTNLTQPANGTATLNANQTVTYTPDADFNGSDSFTYTANDDTVDSNVATVSMTVNPAATDDEVIIDKARYKTKAQMLRIEAESTEESAVLTAYDADTNVLLGVLVNGKLNLKIGSPPANVRVDSDKGGSDTKAVQVK